MQRQAESASRGAMQRSIRRLIIWRLSLVSLLVALLGAIGVMLSERGRISELAIERANVGARALELLAADALEAPTLLAPGALDNLLQVDSRQAVSSRLGSFSYLGIRSASGVRIASRIAAPADDSALRQAVDHFPSLLTHQWGDARYGILRIQRRQFIAVQSPLRNSRGETVAFGQGLILVSPESIREVWHRARWTMLALLLVVGAGAGALYPIIVSLMRNLSEAATDLLEANLDALELLGSAIAKRDSDTDSHNYRVTFYAVRLGEALGLPADGIRALIKGALLHDVGKIGVRDAVLLKPERLTDEEMLEMRRHVAYGRDIVSHSAWLRDAADVVGCHHEKYDGSGYDAGLSGKQIPINARIFTIVDVFDALTCRRPYKTPLSYDETIAMLTRARGQHFDPEALDAFLQIAHELYQRICQRGEDHARHELEEIKRQYFNSNVASLLKA